MSAGIFRRLLVAAILFCIAIPSHAELRIQAYNRIKATQDWHGALKVIREELADPVLKTDAYLAQIRVVALSAMGDVANHHGWDAAFDQDAQRLHAEGLKHAGKDELLQAQVNRLLALYYSKSQRNGLAVKLLRQDLEYWKKVNNTYQIIAGYDGIASGYADMGEIQLEEYYRGLALTIARDYFKLGVSPTSEFEWLQYRMMLGKAMDKSARPGNRAELERLWSLIQPIVEKYLTPKSLSYLNAASHFAIAREPERAAEMYQKARQVWNGERAEFKADLQQRMEGDMLGTEATLLAYSGRWAEAAKSFEALLEQRKALGIAVDDPSMQRMRGWAYEGQGNYDKAIDAYRAAIALFEQTRQSYNVAERASFFRSIARRPYWGLIRSLIKRGQPGDYLEALRAMELVRARQLGELLDPAATSSLSNESLGVLRQSLKPNEVLLAYTLTDAELVIVGMTRDQLFARTTVYDERAFGHQAVSLARRLARPDSPLSDMHEGLGRLSRILLDPVAAHLSGKTDWLILPDGAMNAVPFELLALQSSEYRPLIADSIVRFSPSLRFVDLAARKPSRQADNTLLALADPVYPKLAQVGGIPASELQAVTRSSSVLGNFAPLPETRTEVLAIARLVGESQAVTLLGEKASESELKRADLSRFRFLHLATHGILGGDVPGIGEPALVLAEEQSEDGFLTASEAEKLKLGTELTVLSACNTGSGEYYTGEGVMGMGRAFLVAGSRSVLVSLWPVESKATEALMVSFYRNMQSGKGTAEALRSAKLEMLMPAAPAPAPASVVKGKPGAKKLAVEVKPVPPQQPERSHPFFWAPFVLFGG